MATLQRITPCLWFDDQAEDAARYYTGIFPNSKITLVTRYSDVGTEIHHRAPGSVMVVAFELDGHSFTALNGGPVFTFSDTTVVTVSVAPSAFVCPPPIAAMAFSAIARCSGGRLTMNAFACSSCAICSGVRMFASPFVT